MARSDVAIKFFPTAQLLGPISRDRTGPVEHPLVGPAKGFYRCANIIEEGEGALLKAPGSVLPDIAVMVANRGLPCRSEEHTSELQSLMRISYAVFCLKKKK